MMEWKLSETSSKEKPSMIDESNPSVVYVRKDMTSETRHDEDGNEYTVWVYSEMIVPKKDWSLFKQVFSTHDEIEKLKSDVAYIAMMSEVNLNE